MSEIDESTGISLPEMPPENYHVLGMAVGEAGVKGIIINELQHELDEIRADRENLAIISGKDPLTGISNLRGFHDAFYQLSAPAVHKEQRRATVSGAPTDGSMAVLDLDHFKEVNDFKGHLVGNAVLQKVAKTLTDTLRDTDKIARFGGDEFLILLPDTPPNIAIEVLLRTHEEINNMSSVTLSNGDEYAVDVSASIGITSVKLNDFEGTFAEADDALYKAKEHGRNRIELFLPKIRRQP